MLLPINPAIRQGETVVPTYTDPTSSDDTNALQDTAGNDVATFTTGQNTVRAVINNSTETNHHATGAPTITGTAEVDQTLTANFGTIADLDGLPATFPDDYSFQWRRGDPGTAISSAIPGATSSTYTLVEADVDKRILVQVSFTDGAGNDETLPSARTATVTIQAQAVSASISSTPAGGDTYLAGETITVSLALNEAARVTGRPHVWLDVGGARRRADYSGPIGAVTDALAFSYVVQAGDFDIDGVALCARGRSEPRCESIQLNGGSIRGAEDGLDALLRLPDLPAQAGHRVEGMPPVPPSQPAPTACSAEIEVRPTWALTPTGLNVGDKFRLLFMTSTTRDARSYNIADYNSFVQGRAAAGHASIRDYSGGFRALGSTSAVDARDNTCTTGTGDPIYWLNGAKAADNNADLYDGSWDDEENPRNESGNAPSTTRVWTGSDADGTASNFPLGHGSSVTVGILNSSTSGPVRSGIGAAPGTGHPFYGLSQVFKVRASAATTGISVISAPAIGDTHQRGETP